MVETDNKGPISDAVVLKPLPEVFSGRHAIDETLMATGTTFPLVDRVEYPESGGIMVYYKGMPYPKKGFPIPEALWACDIVKRVLRSYLASLSGWETAIPLAGFALVPWKYKIRFAERFLKQFARVADWLLGQWYLTPKHYCISCKGIFDFTYKFLSEIGISGVDPIVSAAKNEYRKNEITAWQIARIVQTLFEYDDSYRYRMQDIMGEANQWELIARPRKEVKRLGAIYLSRELTHAKGTAKALLRLLNAMLLIPKIRKAFVKACRNINILSMQLDNGDRYHVLLRNDYNFTGRTYDERFKLYLEKHEATMCCGVKPRVAGDVLRQICAKCGKKCEIGYQFPPQVTIKN